MKFKLKHLLKRDRGLIGSRTLSFRYAILTQILSFCRKTVVEFERRNLDVSKPLRHNSVSLNIINEIKDKQGWRALYDVLRQVEAEGAELASKVLKQALLEIRLKLAERIIQRPSIPSIETNQLREILISYLAKPSMGARPQAIVYSLFRVLNEKTKAFAQISTAKATTPNMYAGRRADIECRDSEGNLKLAIAVTDRLDPEKLRSELQRAKANNIKNLLLIGYRITGRRQEFEEQLRKYDRINVAISPLVGFVNTTTVVMNNEMRRELILEVYRSLDELGYQDHLREWDKIIREKLVLNELEA